MLVEVVVGEAMVVHMEKVVTVMMVEMVAFMVEVMVGGTT